MNFEATSQLLGEVYPKAAKVLGSLKFRLEAAKQRGYFKNKAQEQQAREAEISTLHWFLETAAECIELAHQERQSEFKRGYQAGKASTKKRPSINRYNDREVYRDQSISRARNNWPNLY